MGSFGTGNPSAHWGLWPHPIQWEYGNAGVIFELLVIWVIFIHHFPSEPGLFPFRLLYSDGFA